MNALLGQTRRRGDLISHEVHDASRVTNPKTADVIEIKSRYLVVPVATSNPVKECSSMDEAMSFIERYIGLDK